MVSMSGLIETRGEGYEPHCRRRIRRSPAAGTPSMGLRLLVRYRHVRPIRLPTHGGPHGSNRRSQRRQHPKRRSPETNSGQWRQINPRPSTAGSPAILA